MIYNDHSVIFGKFLVMKFFKGRKKKDYF